MDYVDETLSKEDNKWDGDETPATKDRELEFDDDIDPASPFLRSVLSDERLAPGFVGTVGPAVTPCTETTDRVPTLEEWRTM